MKNSKIITKISKTTSIFKSDFLLTTFYFLGAIGSAVFPVDEGKNCGGTITTIMTNFQYIMI